ncbi:hypothetical protein HD554DRAFT_2027169 [Boletus coccyginus]|nr:hypothetical protein HD554DRAFT_2027169 [Boletus coccyginus]
MKSDELRGIVSACQAHAYHHASDLPEEVWGALFQNEAAANVILPFATKASAFPRGGDNDQLWIALYDETRNVEFVSSCTKGPLGNYPIFIVASKSSAQIAQEEERGRDIADSLLPLVLCLLKEVPPQRVFSVFSITRVAEKFAAIFEAYIRREYSNILALRDPYYDATFTFCTRETLSESLDFAFPRESEDITVDIRRADPSHLEEIKVLCKKWSESLPLYILDDERAELEARILIANQQVWVCIVQKDGQESEIACLVATTRESDNVAAVTRVFTAERWRGRGYAARLLHRVCQDILLRKKRVVLYVAESAPSRKVYHKIGFHGLGPQIEQAEDVERWVEIGFNGTALGYW